MEIEKVDSFGGIEPARRLDDLLDPNRPTNSPFLTRSPVPLLLYKRYPRFAVFAQVLGTGSSDKL